MTIKKENFVLKKNRSPKPDKLVLEELLATEVNENISCTGEFKEIYVEYHAKIRDTNLDANNYFLRPDKGRLHYFGIRKNGNPSLLGADEDGVHFSIGRIGIVIYYKPK